MDGWFSSNFTQHYQPIVALDTLEAAQFEALLRPVRPMHGLDEVIARMELSGEIQALDLWSLKTAIAKLEATSLAAKVAVNVSARSVSDPAFAARAEAILEQMADGVMIRFEITETQQISSMSAARDFCSMARAHGCLVGLDDFGAGHALFSTAESLHLDYLKLSSKLTTKIGISFDAEAVMLAVVAATKARGMLLVGEHIETITQLEWMRHAGVDYGQGWLFSKALPEIQVGRKFNREVGQENELMATTTPLVQA